STTSSTPTPVANQPIMVPLSQPLIESQPLWLTTRKRVSQARLALTPKSEGWFPPALLYPLVHDLGGRHAFAARSADRARWHARNRATRRDLRKHNRTRGNARVLTDLDIAQHLRAGADHHAAADFRMAIAALFAGAAERHRVEHGDIVLDHRGLANDDAVRVVDEHARADLGGRMDVDSKQLRHPALQVIREDFALLAPEPIGDA